MALLKISIDSGFQEISEEARGSDIRYMIYLANTIACDLDEYKIRHTGRERE